MTSTKLALGPSDRLSHDHSTHWSYVNWATSFIWVPEGPQGSFEVASRTLVCPGQCVYIVGGSKLPGCQCSLWCNSWPLEELERRHSSQGEGQRIPHRLARCETGQQLINQRTFTYRCCKDAAAIAEDGRCLRVRKEAEDSSLALGLNMDIAKGKIGSGLGGVIGSDSRHNSLNPPPAGRQFLVRTEKSSGPPAHSTLSKEQTSVRSS